MNPIDGDVYALRESLLSGAEIGEQIDTDEMRTQLQDIVDATEDELAASHQELLVRIEEQAAQRLKLGAREQERRRRRRQAERRSRKRNR